MYQFIILDGQHKIKSVTGSLFFELGILYELSVGKIFFDQVPKPWYSELHHCFHDVHNNGKSFSKEVQFQRKAKKTITLAVAIEPQVRNKRITGISLTFQDAAALRRERQHIDLREKMKNLSVLAANIAHELNNPLAALLNQTGCMLMEQWTADDLEHLHGELELIQEQIYSMSLITNALDAFSKDSKDNFRLLQVNDIVEKSITLSKLLLTKDEIHYKVLLKKSLPLIRGNEITLEQSFINILRNAIEAMPNGGTITVTSSIDEVLPDYVNISIKDTGVGIPGKIQEMIIEPFYKMKNGKHAGLGLSISYGILANHNGMIEVSSKVNKGTTITILLPIVRHKNNKTEARANHNER